MFVMFLDELLYLCNGVSVECLIYQTKGLSLFISCFNYHIDDTELPLDGSSDLVTSSSLVSTKITRPLTFYGHLSFLSASSQL